MHMIHHHFPLIPTARKFLPQIISMSSSSHFQHQQNSLSKSKSTKSESETEQVLTYHNQTKHYFTHYARGPHNLDWANQPNPFRRYPPTPLLHLNHPPPHTNSPFYPSIFSKFPSPNPLNITTLSLFFHTSLSLSAWKSTGFSTWSLRVNPSSGNLHPTECYIISPPVHSLSQHAFVAHYAPKEHALELRAEIEPAFFNSLPEGSFFIGFSSIFWREAWKYGERGFRYCNHDVGHAVAAVTIAAAGMGWDVRVLDGLGYDELEKMMGLGEGSDLEIESEHADCILLVFPVGGKEFEVDYERLRMGVLGLEGVEWRGEANGLSKEHVCWDVIYKTAEVVKKGFTGGKEILPVDFMPSGVISEGCYKGFSVSELVRRRRSAVDMDGVSTMELGTFYQVLLHCMPSGCGEKQRRQLAMPFRCMPWDCKVHCVLFVHRVVGLKSGLYFLVRNEDHFDELRNVTRAEFRWVKPAGCPDELPLYELAVGDCREVSKRLSCLQDIASDGCFSLGMVAHLEPTLKETGSWMYPRVFWETGVLGQVLYLEAHAVGLSATGIGCFFDDPVHEILGLKGMRYQSLYHFTVGAPVVDKRIMSLPAYPGPDVDA